MHHLNANAAEIWGSVYQAPHLHGAAGSAHFAELIPKLAVGQGESGSKLAVEAQCSGLGARSSLRLTTVMKYGLIDI